MSQITINYEHNYNKFCYNGDVFIPVLKINKKTLEIVEPDMRPLDVLQTERLKGLLYSSVDEKRYTHIDGSELIKMHVSSIEMYYKLKLKHTEKKKLPQKRIELFSDVIKSMSTNDISKSIENYEKIDKAYKCAQVETNKEVFDIPKISNKLSFDPLIEFEKYFIRHMNFLYQMSHNLEIKVKFYKIEYISSLNNYIVSVWNKIHNCQLKISEIINLFFETRHDYLIHLIWRELPHEIKQIFEIHCRKLRKTYVKKNSNKVTPTPEEMLRRTVKSRISRKRIENDITSRIACISLSENQPEIVKMSENLEIVKPHIKPPEKSLEDALDEMTI